MRYKNWKMYYTMMGSTALASLGAPTTYKWTQMDNIARDPFENAVGDIEKTAMSAGGALAAPMTAYQYDWNLLPIGQLLWLKELESYKSSRRCKRRKATTSVRSMPRSRRRLLARRATRPAVRL